MNWITKFLKPKIASLFKKKSAESDQVLWTTCECKNLIYKEDLEKNYNCCPKCGSHHKLSCKERFEIFFDKKEYEIIETPLPKDDPLNFVDNKKYTDRLKTARKITKQDDAVAIATGRVENIQVTVGAQDFRFIGGSFGAASGEAFIHGVQHAIENKNPFIFYSCSGGQRLMESGIALLQMSRTVLAVNELKKNKWIFIIYSVLSSMNKSLSTCSSKRASYKSKILCTNCNLNTFNIARRYRNSIILFSNFSS